MFKTDILFTGFYGQSNTGDDAFVEVASWGAKHYWNKTDCRFLARENMLPDTIVPARGYPFALNRTYEFQANLLLNNSDALIFAGGSTIHSKLAESNIRMKALRRKVNKGGLKIGAIGVSVGPFKSSEDEKSVQDYLKQMDFLAVRDQTSFNYVNTLDLPYKPVNAFDLAALLPDIYKYQKNSHNYAAKKVIGVSLCPYESIQRGLNVNQEMLRNTMLIELLKELKKEGNIHFRFYVINGNEKIGDKSLTIETIAKVAPHSYEIIDYSKSTQKIWESIADCDFVISTRLHAAIFACFSSTPFMLNEYHRKCTDFLQNIKYDDQYRLFDSLYEIKEKATQIMEILYGNDNYHAPKNVNDMKERAKLNFTQINI